MENPGVLMLPERLKQPLRRLFPVVVDRCTFVDFWNSKILNRANILSAICCFEEVLRYIRIINFELFKLFVCQGFVVASFSQSREQVTTSNLSLIDFCFWLLVFSSHRDLLFRLHRLSGLCLLFSIRWSCCTVS